MFSLLETLADGKLHGLQELARLFEVSTRTIWRDIAVLRDCGFAIDLDHLDEGKGSGIASFQLVNPSVARNLMALRRTA